MTLMMLARGNMGVWVIFEHPVFLDKNHTLMSGVKRQTKCGLNVVVKTFDFLRLKC